MTEIRTINGKRIILKKGDITLEDTDAVVNAAEEDVIERVIEFAQIPGVRWIDGVDCIIETSGATAARECMIPSIARYGRIAIVGVGQDDKVINPTHIHGKACTIIGSVVFPLGWSWDFARFLAAGGMSFAPAITHRFPLDEAPEALRVADEGHCGKVLFAPNG